MSSAVDVKISSTPNLEKLENFFNDSSYRELIEYCVNFNTRLCLERRLRLPFLDPQTGVAQNHCQLFVDKRQRMPGFRQGQIYTYPSARWRKSRRQYLSKMYRFPDRPFQALRKDHEALVATGAMVSGTASPTVAVTALSQDPDFNGTLMEESSSLGAAGGDTSDSKDSQQQQMQQQIKEDLPKDWFYDEIDINDNDSLEEPKSPADDEYDYDPRYGNKKRRKRKPGKKGGITPGESVGPGRRRGGAGRGRGASNAVCVSSSLGDSSLSGLDSLDGLSSSDIITSTPTTSQGPGRRPRGGGTRGRRRTKATTAGNCNPPSPGLNSEPPSFESAAAAVGVMGSDLAGVGEDHNADLRNYRKYL